MEKHFVNGSKVELTYKDRTRTNSKSHLYDEVVFAETPERPETAKSEFVQLMYEDDEVYWQVKEE